MMPALVSQSGGDLMPSGEAETPHLSPPESAPEGRSYSVLDAVVLFGLLLGFYHVNGVLYLSNSVTANAALPISILNEGNLTFTTAEHPNMFEWQVEEEGEAEPIYIHAWQQLVRGEAAEERLKRGEITLVGSQYFLVESVHEGKWVNAEGIGAGLTALPVLAVLHAAVGDLRQHTMLTLYAGKLVAASCVAGSAVFLFLAASLYLRRNAALLVALTYGLATGVWSISSQGLMPHGPNVLYLAMACYFLIRSEDEPRVALYSGLAAGMAAACRPGSLVFIVVTMVLFAIRDRQRLVRFGAGAAALVSVQLLYNITHLGVLWSTGITDPMLEIARMKTGTPSIWQFHVLESAAGLLVSPSRGLLVYSPAMAFALVGAVLVWRRPRHAALRPLTVIFAVSLAIQLCHYDWWGGWSYGYRPIVDLTIYLGLFLIPVMEILEKRRVVAGVFGVALAWSFVVQGLGAFAALGSSWNNRLVYELELDGRIEESVDFDYSQELLDEGKASLVRQHHCDVDRPECRHRLWSVSDNQIGFLIANYSDERNHKRYLSSLDRIW